MHTVIAAAIVKWHSRLNACVRVNGGHFEPLTFCCDLFVSLILVALNVIDINMCKVPKYCVKCVTFVSETFTRYGSNITNVWQKIFYANDFGILL